MYRKVSWYLGVVLMVIAISTLTVFCYRGLQTEYALLRVKGGYCDAHYIQHTLQMYKDDRGSFPLTLQEAFNPALGYAQAGALASIIKNGKVTYLPLACEGKVASYVAIYEANPDRYNATFVIIDGAPAPGGDWSSLYNNIYIRPGERHV